MKLRLIDWNLRHKIILHIFVVGVLAAILLFYFYFSMQNALIDTLYLQKAEMVATLIDCNVTHHMEQGRSSSVGPTLSQIAAPNSIERLRIIDLEGRILNSSDPKEIDGKIDLDDLAAVKSLYPDLDQDHIFGLKPVTATKSYLAIPNREECFGCHSPETRVLGILEVQLSDTYTSSLISRFQLKSITIALIALAVLIFIILRLFEKIINRPLAQLKDYMKRIQAGDLSVQLKPKKNDEIGNLTQNFNTMVKKLEEANARIEDLHNQQMERAGHLASLGELAADLAHEIRNPIAGIKGALEIITERTDSDDPKKEIFIEIIKQTDKIHMIVQDLLNYAKPKDLEMMQADPNLCLQEAINLAKPQTKDKEIRFHYEDLEKDIGIVFDANKLQEVILNLLLNSIAAIDKAGSITLIIEHPKDNEIVISISDTGKGIKPEHLDQLFTPFFTTRKEGTGLRLSICKQIIEAHKGRIEVQSELGKGTTFFIHLPLRKDGLGMSNV
ncbi:MAG: HAMP domain-containing protein [Candidatus Aminicenantes bacterium]|nr:HAMP domain-containing protein [Candidatus Aminicenantes bacterium]